ncbi:poly(U)-specific endoribonuclease homolog [Copidosoma floridanum]|uniref:poly(U)-specific endoribonuclease homolog n=1 Tax=Copidosoma floridanum TaxID=29053 RepID=UPI0006C93FAA|nr:poly(U)-specific endoribonuclease homolog [Copidosoma floridanum]
MRGVHFLILLLSLSLIIDSSSAGWKFWKNKKDKDNKDEPVSPDAASSPETSSTTTTTTTTTTTAAPSSTTSSSGWKFWQKKKNDESSSTAAPKSTTTRATPTPKGRTTSATPASANKGIASAADPALAIGVGSVGGKIREDANNQPRKLNPGEPNKPSRPGTHKDWAADFAGAERGGPPPKVPAQAPDAHAGSRPASVPGTPAAAVTHQQSTPAPGDKRPLPAKPVTAQSSTTHRPTLAPVSIAKPTLAPVAPSSTAKPTGTRTWADVAGGGKSPSSTPTKPAHGPFEYPHPGNKPGDQPTTAKPSGLSPGAVVAAGGAAAAAGTIEANAGKSTYQMNPVYSKGIGVTDEDLEKLSEALFLRDVNNAYKYITLNLQKKTKSSNPKDEAPEPLLTVKPEALKIPTIERVLSIYDNYKLNTKENEVISPLQREEEKNLVDTFLSTNVMSHAMRFLADKGFVQKNHYVYHDILRQLWFNLYSRGGGLRTSTGFEHVFLTELKLGTEVSGLHNWIYFNAQELNKKLDYLGYIKKIDLGDKAAIVKLHMRYDGIDKPVTNIFVGTSPELEMALYTICFYARPDTLCPVSLGGTKFNIITHKFTYRSRAHIGSAYPNI